MPLVSPITAQSTNSKPTKPNVLKRISLVSGVASLSCMTACMIQAKNKKFKHHKTAAIIAMVTALTHVMTAMLSHHKKVRAKMSL